MRTSLDNVMKKILLQEVYQVYQHEKKSKLVVSVS